MNSGKFKVVHELETYLPVCPYDAEWTVLGQGKTETRGEKKFTGTDD